MAPQNDRFWYAIRVRAKSEKVTSTALRWKGYEEFAAFYRCQRKRSDRLKEIDAPLFPGYVFCKFSKLERVLPILIIPSVVHIVGSGKTPLPIPDEEIAAIRTVIGAGLRVQPWPYLNVGCRVCIERGPLSGIQGIVNRVGAGERLIVSVNLLQRSVAVGIDRNWVSPISMDLNGSGPAVCGSGLCSGISDGVNKGMRRWD